MDAQQPSSFAILLRRLRREAGFTQESLAERAGIAWRTISDLERGLSRPRRDTLVLLVEALALTGERRAAFEAAAHRKVDPPGAAMESAPATLAWPGTTASAAPLVGRAQELALLDRHLAGQGVPVLLLAGQPGIGKSRLLREIAARAHARGWRVLGSGCARGADQPVFAPLLQALQYHLAGRSPAERRRALRGCAWLVRLLPELPEDEIEPLPNWTLPPEQERRLMFEAVRHFLANVAGPAGTLLLLDDLQWAGPDALALQAALLQPASKTPLRVVGAYRDTEVGPDHPLNAAIAELAERQLATEHALRPLAQHEATELFAHLLAGIEEAPAAEVVRRAGGIPFFLISCVRELERADNGEPTTPGVPWDLRRSIQRRLMVLPESARTLLAVAAVIGRVTPLPLLTVVLRRAAGEVLDALESACRAGLLEEVGDDAYGFVHDVIREVVEGDLGMARRRLLHRQVAEALQAQPGTKPVEALAYHFLEAGEPAWAVPYLEQAGDLAEARYAHEAAAAHYQNLVTCLEKPGNVQDIGRALEKLAAVLITVARYGEALTVLERAAEMLRSAGDLDALGRVEGWIADVHNERGSMPAGVARLEAVLELLESHGPSSGLVHAYCALTMLFAHNGQVDRAVERAERAKEMARVVGDHRLHVFIGVVHSRALMSVGRAEEALQVAREAVQLATRMDDPQSLYRAVSELAWSYEECGEYTPAKQAAERALARSEQLRNPLGIMWNTNRLGVVALLTGDWSRARTYLERAIDLARETGHVAGYPSIRPRCDLGHLCMVEGRWDEATHHLEEVLAAFADQDERILRLVAHGQLAEREVLAGNPAAAIARLVPLLDQPGAEERMVTQYILPVLAWAYYERGEMDQAADTAVDAIRRARAGTARLGLVHALRVHALVLLSRQHWAEAAGTLEEGLTLTRSMPYPHGEGRLLHVQGQLQARIGEPASARSSLDAALAIFQRLGARKDIELVEREIAALISPYHRIRRPFTLKET